MYLCLQLNLELEHHEAARASFKPVVAHDQAVETVADFAASDGNIFSSGSSQGLLQVSEAHPRIFVHTLDVEAAASMILPRVCKTRVGAGSSWNGMGLAAFGEFGAC